MTDFNRDSVIKPGVFGTFYAADTRRGEFDRFNEALLMDGVHPDALGYAIMAKTLRETLATAGITALG